MKVGDRHTHSDTHHIIIYSWQMLHLYVCVVCTEVHGRSDGVVASYGNSPDETTYESSFSDCDSMATDQPSHKETVADVDNPLYSNTGPVTFSKSTVQESVSKHLSSLSLTNFSQFVVMISISRVSIHTD